ncbi:A disintegrin and metalloproteinase with thrombospondin motifs 15 [Protopterus annectens]|uniref:A disintegrin and metalloproteinase with thrombospondin motifs 15 n=1 Tax=Protopterus annectens TaxID=7888 RepID=UPI001CFBBDF2|nr:A disintegrin and metalloproteinase with thrombospondin motifs 15 [Protopterus annectens]
MAPHYSFTSTTILLLLPWVTVLTFPCLVNGSTGGLPVDNDLDSELVIPHRMHLDINGHQYFSSGGNDIRERNTESEHNVIFQLRAFGQDFYLNLVPDSRFMAPVFAQAAGEELQKCFYSGDVNAERGSFAAMSLCGMGLHGAFGSRGVHYLLEPLSNSSVLPLYADSLPPHLLHRRHPLAQSSDTTSRCGVGSTSTDSVLRALEWYKTAHMDSKEESIDPGRLGGENFTPDKQLKKQGEAATPQGRKRNKHVPLRKVQKSAGRTKRFASLPRYVEALLVADETMVKFHGDNLQHYLLTLFSVAASVYRHPSILHPINLAVVKVIILRDEDKGPKVTSNAAVSLRNFCTWQKKLNKVDDKHPEYWDTAILFTKQDLCGATTCDTLGMADVGTMCDPKRSCSVIEDDGLPSAFTTAHELGHVFNMPHDSVKACEEAFGKLKDNHMMSPTLIQIDHNNPWSTCSAAVITDFLDNGHGDCLLDEPVKPIVLPAELPGEHYGLSQQCELAFGRGSKPCPYMQPCAKLWCTGKARGQLVCQTRHFPWADGTSCKEGKFCLKGACVEKHTPSKYKVDGGWGRWGPYGTCSRTCGGGVQLAKRECNDPVPSSGGKYCEGMRIKYRSCNLSPCLETGKSFREEQCESFNSYNHSTNRLSSTVGWVPKYSGVLVKDQCKLICRANGTGYFYVLAPKVVDGTQCSPDSTSICVQGKCMKAGCDGKLGSKAKFDKCGVCNGDNRSCKKVSGLFTKPIHGYNFIVKIPVGASNIDIRQRGYKGMAGDDNYLAVKNGNGKYFQNGHFIVSAVERDIIIKGSVLRYSGTTTAVETLQAFRPIQEPLIIEVLSVGRMTPPRVRYSFYIPKDTKDDKHSLKKEINPAIISNQIPSDYNKVTSTKPVYSAPSVKWTSGDWDECTVTCGTGVQKRRVECRDSYGQIASSCDSSQKPNVLRVCGDPCPLWEVGDWTPCSKTCGKGFKRRILKCKAHSGLIVPREKCSLKKKPQELYICTIRPC